MAFATQVKAFPSSPKNIINKGSNTVGKGQNTEGHRQKQQLINNGLQHSHTELHMFNVITNYHSNSSVLYAAFHPAPQSALQMLINM